MSPADRKLFDQVYEYQVLVKLKDAGSPVSHRSNGNGGLAACDNNIQPPPEVETDRLEPSNERKSASPCANDWPEMEEMAALAVPAKQVSPMVPMIPATRAEVIFDFMNSSLVW
jgi:hypothetical protein